MNNCLYDQCYVINREKPLTFYVFTENKATFELISNSTSSGAIVCNDTMQYYSCELCCL